MVDSQKYISTAPISLSTQKEKKEAGDHLVCPDKLPARAGFISLAEMNMERLGAMEDMVVTAAMAVTAVV